MNHVVPVEQKLPVVVAFEKWWLEQRDALEMSPAMKFAAWSGWLANSKTTPPEALRSEDDPFAMQDAWNSAIDAAAMVAWNHEPDVDGPIETAIRALRLKPCAPSPRGKQ